jgi:hypothetical protein
MKSNLIWFVSAALIFSFSFCTKKEQQCTKLTKADAYRTKTMKA